MLLDFVYACCFSRQPCPVHTLNDMHRKANALAALFTAVVSLRTRPMALKSHRQRLFELLSMVIYVLQGRSRTTRLLHSTPLPRFGPRGSYDIEKSNTLIIMRNHRNNVWFRQFFR